MQLDRDLRLPLWGRWPRTGRTPTMNLTGGQSIPSHNDSVSDQAGWPVERESVMNYNCNVSKNVQQKLNLDSDETLYQSLQKCSVSLRRSANYLSFEVTDVDRVCPPTVLERVAVFAVVPIIVSPVPVLSSACLEKVILQADDGTDAIRLYQQARIKFDAELYPEAIWSDLSPAFPVAVRRSLEDDKQTDYSQWSCGMYDPALLPSERLPAVATACTTHDSHQVLADLLMTVRSVATVEYGLVLRFPRTLRHHNGSEVEVKDWLMGQEAVDRLTPNMVTFLNSESSYLLVHIRTATHTCTAARHLPANVTSEPCPRDGELHFDLRNEPRRSIPTSPSSLDVVVRGGGTWRSASNICPGWTIIYPLELATFHLMHLMYPIVWHPHPRPAIEYVLKTKDTGEGTLHGVLIRRLR